MRVIDVTASSQELAIEKGLQMLGTTEENVDIVVLEKGSMLKKAKIEITFFENEQEKLEYYQEKENKEKEEKANKIVFNESNDEEKQEKTDLSEKEIAVRDRLVEFVKKIAELGNVECDIQGRFFDDELNIIVKGENTGKLIGYHGDNLQALHLIINTIVRNEYKEFAKKVFIDIEGYRERRKDSAESLAKKMAYKVIKEKRSLKLEPMNSYERKVIHSILTGIEHISTHSEGVEPNRYLVIDYVK